MHTKKESLIIAATLAEHCRLCSGSKRGALIRCTVSGCPIKTIKDRRYTAEAGELLGAVRQKCLYCMCGQRSLVRRCTQTDCLLWQYRDNQALKEGTTWPTGSSVRAYA